MRLVLAIAFVLAATVAADAITRVKISAPVHRPNAEIICPWVSGSVAWDWPPAQQAMMLGQCPPPASPR